MEEVGETTKKVADGGDEGVDERQLFLLVLILRWSWRNWKLRV